MTTTTMTRYQFFGHLVYYIAWILNKTLRVRVIFKETLLKDKVYLSAFWHGHQIYPALSLIKYHSPKQAALVSPSKDGEIVSTFLKKWGYKTIRGSSRRDAVKSSLEILRVLEEGYSFGFAIDGPLGPRHKAKLGAVRMAQKLNMEIVPIGSICNRKWIFQKAWDKFELPKPFSKIVVYVDEPLAVPKHSDITQINEELERRIHAAEQKAKEALLMT